jgi:TadE-like protein
MPLLATSSPGHATVPAPANSPAGQATVSLAATSSPGQATVSLRANSPAGQATVEFIAMLPLVAFVLAALWQLALVGYAEWGASAAARAAARASAIGGDPAVAARSHVGGALRGGLHVRSRAPGDVRVALRIPTLPGVPGLGHARATGHFEPQS